MQKIVIAKTKKLIIRIKKIIRAFLFIGGLLLKSETYPVLMCPLKNKIINCQNNIRNITHKNMSPTKIKL